MTLAKEIRRLALAILAVGAVASAVGCSRMYMTPTHGRAFREAFALQTVNPDKQTDPKAVMGLDSQEASIISASYRRGLSPQQAGGASDQQMLTYSSRGAVREAPPATSVPAEH